MAGTCSGLLSLAMPLLAGAAGEAVHDAALSYILLQSLSEKKKMDEEEEEERKRLEGRQVLRTEFLALQAVPFGRRSPAQVSRLHAVAEALDDVWEAPSSQPRKRKRNERRKKKLPKASSSRSSSTFAARPWKPGHYFLRALCLWQSCSVSGYCSDRRHVYMRQSGGFWNMPGISTRRWPSVLRSILRFLVLWIFWEMTSGKCSWIVPEFPYSRRCLVRQWTHVHASVYRYVGDQYFSATLGPTVDTVCVSLRSSSFHTA